MRVASAWLRAIRTLTMADSSETTASRPASGPMAPPKPTAIVAESASSAILRRRNDSGSADCAIWASRSRSSTKARRPATRHPPSPMTSTLNHHASFPDQIRC